MTSTLIISLNTLAELYRSFRYLPFAFQEMYNSGISFIYRHPDKYIYLEKKLSENLICNGAAQFEITILSKLKHINIVQYFDAYIAIKEKFYRLSTSLYMQYYNRGLLVNKIEKQKKDAQ